VSKKNYTLQVSNSTLYQYTTCPYFESCCCSCRWGESQNCGHQWTYCSSPIWYEHKVSWWNAVKRENRKPRRKPVPVPLCPRQIPHGVTKARTCASAVTGRRLTAWATTRRKDHDTDGLTKFKRWGISVGWPTLADDPEVYTFKKVSVAANHHTVKIAGEWTYSSLDTRRWWVVSSTIQPLYPQGIRLLSPA
jgi:hypothetical protein